MAVGWQVIRIDYETPQHWTVDSAPTYPLHTIIGCIHAMVSHPSKVERMALVCHGCRLEMLSLCAATPQWSPGLFTVYSCADWEYLHNSREVW